MEIKFKKCSPQSVAPYHGSHDAAGYDLTALQRHTCHARQQAEQRSLTKINTYRKIPVAVQAVQWTGGNYTEVCKLNEQRRRLRYDGEHKTLTIETLEGEMAATLGDYIIKGVEGELYPCKATVFEKTYTASTEEIRAPKPEPRVEIILYGEPVPDAPETMSIGMKTTFSPCPPLKQHNEMNPEWGGYEIVLQYLEVMLTALMRHKRITEIK